MHNPESIPLAPALRVAQQIARVVSRGEDTESRVQDTLRLLSQSFGLDRPRILLVDPEVGGLAIRYAHGLTAADLSRGHCRIGEGVSGQVFETGQAALARDVADEPAYGAQTIDRSALPGGQVAFLAVAIIRNHVAIGVLGALRLHDCEQPFQDDLALLEVIAAFIGQLLFSAEVAPPSASRPRPAPHGLAVEVDPLTAAGDPAAARLDLMLRTAQTWHRLGHLHQTMDLLLKVIRHDADSAQAQIAQTQVLRIAERYETTGLRRLAIDALERLERAGPDVGDAPNRRFLDREDSGKGSSGGRGGNAPAADGSDDGGGLYMRLRRSAG
jgi:Nif-specific regulatory protein